MNVPVWKLERVTLSGRPEPRLSDVSLEISTGVTAILGHSGAGKTSLLNLLVGFEQPGRGTIAQGFSQSGARLPLFWVPADNGLWPHLTVCQHVMAVQPGASSGEPHQDHLLKAFNLSDKSGSFPDQLSEGERGRLALVRALASDAEILVLDEPLVHVEPAGSRRYWERIGEELGRSARTAVVFSTHSPEVVLREAQQVVCLSEGRVVYSGNVKQLYHDPPDSHLAWCLGPANWVGADKPPEWLLGHTAGRRCYRPEEIDVAIAESSPLVVEEAIFAGSMGEVEVLDEHSGRSLRIFHRPALTALRVGQRVAFRVLALIAACLFVAGCTNASAEPQLAVRAIASWSMPAEGVKVPTPRAVHVGLDHEVFVLDNAGRVLVYDSAGQLLRQWWMPEYDVGKPEKICQLRDGRLAVADTHYHRVIFFDAEGRELARRGSLGREPGQYIYPVAVVEDDAENYYVCEYGSNDRVQKFDKQGTFLLQFGSFGTDKGQFQRPSGIVWREGKVYVVDAFNSRIQVFSDQGVFLEILAEGNDSAALNYPYDIATNENGDLFVVEYGAGRVTKFDCAGKLLGRYGTTGSDEGHFWTPWGIAVDGESRVYVADTGNRRLVELEF
ncbi:MAG TPA: ATP-binding cassette domain-containing protein [Planctomycetaceae bacterium]|nr:ATP-binding cassette domain-containing protein [Planctomycetaceae bacterium]